MNTKFSISLSNHLINGYLNCTLPQRRVLYSALAYLNPNNDKFKNMSPNEIVTACKNDHTLCQVRIPLADFVSHWKLKSKSAFIETERVADELLDVYWITEDIETSKEKMIRAVNSIDPSDYGYLRIQFTPEMMAYFIRPHKHPKGYTTIPYSFLPKKKSLFSLIFLERCLQKLSYSSKGGKSKVYSVRFEHTIHNLQARFSITNKDVQFRDFKTSVLNKIEKEINSIECCSLTYEVIKRRDKNTNRPKAYKIVFTFYSDSYVNFKSTTQNSLEMVQDEDIFQINSDYLPSLTRYELCNDDIPF